jgi:hypothetical protein
MPVAQVGRQLQPKNAALFPPSVAFLLSNATHKLLLIVANEFSLKLQHIRVPLYKLFPRSRIEMMKNEAAVSVFSFHVAARSSRLKLHCSK